MADTPKKGKARSDGEGSIYYRKDRDRWVGAVTVGYRDGKPIRRRISANSRSAAATKLRKLREEHERGQVPTGAPMTVKKWMGHWLDNIAARKVGELTLIGYRSKINNYIIPLLGHHRIDRLTSDHIESAWHELRTKGCPTAEHPKPLGTATILQTHAILRRALKVAGQRGHLTRNPAASTSMDAPSHTPKEMGTLTLDEARKVLATVAGTRNEARYTVALALGLRQGEALGLTWDQVDLDNGVLRVRQALSRIKGKGLVLRTHENDGLKSKSSRRDIVIPERLNAILRKHRSRQQRDRLAAGDWYDPRGFVFCHPDGRPIDPSRDAKDWAALLASAGVEHRRLHDARHTAATLLLLQGVDSRVAMQILGHSQISVTMRYQHVVDEMQQDAAARMDRALWG